MVIGSKSPSRNSLLISVAYRQIDLFTKTVYTVCVRDLVSALKLRSFGHSPPHLSATLSWDGGSETISLISQPRHFGGVRWWLLCCRCKRRVASLFWRENK